ncbi:MAG: cell division protein ZipA [Candidatus Thiodiazotropha sp. (ex Ctena orbiculata)]|nr:cell division protein ZipA [Candidatus Thiodiazotropha taylori]
MDATTLRIVLLLLGLVFLAAIYFYETNRRKREMSQARRRVVPEFKEPEILPPAEDEPVVGDEVTMEHSENLHHQEEDTWAQWEEEDTEQLNEEFPDSEPMRADDEITSDLEMRADDSFETPEQQELFGFSAQEESPVDVPKLIIQINLKARKAPFNGLDIQKAMSETGMVMGSLSIYHRLSSDSRQAPQFNLASMVEPGTFPSEDVEQFTTPGLTLFTQLPVPGDSMAVFSDLLFTAERLAALLDGELQDDTHSALTKQTIEHLRGQIIEHRRQVQLARSKG